MVSLTKKLKNKYKKIPTFFYTPLRPSFFEIELKSFSEKITSKKKSLILLFLEEKKW